LDKFVPEGVDPKTRALEAYIAAKEPVLSKVLSQDEIKALSDRAAQATGAAKEVEAAQAGRQEALKGVSAEGEKALKDAVAARKATMAKYGNKDLGKLARTSSDDDTINIVRSIIGADDGAARMASLAKEVGKTPGGTDALKKAVAEVIKREASTTAEAGTSGMMQMDRRALHGFMSTRTDALKAAGLSDHQVGILRAVTEDALQANRTISAVKSKGGSDTDSLNAMREKLAKPGHGSMLGHIAVDSALAGAGHLAGGLFGAYLGKTIGDKVVAAAREAGLNRVKQLRVEAVLNPDLALALMKEAPRQPNRDAAAILALRLRQMSMAGILGAQQH
jgi:hypothetical protein